MSCLTWIPGDSPVHARDGRVKLLAALALTAGVAVADGAAAGCVSLVAGALLAAGAGLPPRLLVRVLLKLNGMLLMMAVLTIPWTPGRVVAQTGPLAITAEGLALAARMAWKGNALVLIYTALLATTEPAALGAAMRRLGVPVKLAQVYLMTVRYADVLHHELARIRLAMRARAFRPGFNRRTYAATAHAVGMLLVRSVDRAERIGWAMKCRGFDGRFHAAPAGPLARADLVFGAAAFLAAAGIVWMGGWS